MVAHACHVTLSCDKRAHGQRKRGPDSQPYEERNRHQASCRLALKGSNKCWPCKRNPRGQMEGARIEM